MRLRRTPGLSESTVIIAMNSENPAKLGFSDRAERRNAVLRGG